MENEKSKLKKCKNIKSKVQQWVKMEKQKPEKQKWGKKAKFG